MDATATGRLEPVTLEVSREPVFVIGAPRSGTTVLAWALAQHPDFWTGAETDFLFLLFGQGHLRRALRSAAERPDGGWLAKNGVAETDLLAALGTALNAVFTSRSRGRRWVDQSPTYTLMLDELADLFPTARFLHILRDGRNVVASMVHSGFAAPWASDFALAAQTWALYTQAATAFADRVPERTLTVSYPSLSDEPEACLAEVLAFLGADDDERPARLVRSRRINSSYQPDGARDEPYRGPGDPWSTWTPKQRQVFLKEAGATMDALGLAAPDESAR